MWQVGSIAFLNPWALAALIALPIIWWLLRFTPPRPDRIDFPPFRFLLELVSREETPHKTPWWLIALRLLAAGLLIVALAQPVLNKTLPVSAGNGPMLVVVDDGWASAKDWQRRMGVLQEIVDSAEQSGRLISIQTTAPRSAPRPIEPQRARDVSALASALQPQPLTPDRAALGALLTPALQETSGLQVTWLSDGLDYGSARAFAETLEDLGSGANVSVLAPPPVEVSHVMDAVTLEEGNLTVSVKRADTVGAANGAINAVALNGRVLGTVSYQFENDAAEAKATLELPVALRNEVARMYISDARSAGSVFLLDDSWRRKSVGLVSGASLYFA
ncbi:MAG: BatA domain-containing protein, partial [Pseudomonadota bacterium]